MMDYDGILTISYHGIIIMIEYSENAIIKRGGCLDIEEVEIERYLEEVKRAVISRNYRLERNSRRQENNDLFYEYVIDEEKVRQIILSLTVLDFSEKVRNRHRGFEHEWLCIFGKDVRLLRRFGTGSRVVPLYIKFNKLDNNFVIVISFHEQNYELSYYFR